MTNDTEKIKLLTGYPPGKCIVRTSSTSAEVVETYCGQAVFDDVSRNFHIMPADEALREELAEEFRLRRQSLSEAIRRRCGVLGIKFVSVRGDDPLPSDALCYFYQEGSRGTHPKWPEFAGIYRYLSFFFRGGIYRVNFMRFFTDADRIDCLMRSLQYDYRLPGVLFPPTKNDGDKGSLPLQGFYNPHADYFDSDDCAAETFMDFILSLSGGKN